MDLYGWIFSTTGAVGTAGGRRGRVLAAGALLLLGIAATASADFRLTDPTSSVYYDHALLAGTKLKLGERATATGNVHSNGTLEIGEHASVAGNATSVGKLTNRGTVTGTVSSPAPALTLPALASKDDLRRLANRVLTGNQTFTNAVIDDVVFVDGDVKIHGTIRGTGTIIAAKDIRVDEAEGNVTLDPATRLSFIAMNDVRLGEKRALRGALYAGRDVTLDENASFEGVAVARRELKLGEKAQLRFLDLDAVPPAIQLLSPADGALLATARPGIQIGWSDAFSGLKLSTARFLLDGTDRTAQATVSTTGLQLTPAQGLPEGPHTIDVTVADNSANVAHAVFHFTTDTLPPAIAITSPTNGQVVSNPALQVTGTVTDASAIASLTVNGQAAARSGNAFSAAVTLVAGANTITVVATDAAGNASQATATATLQQGDTIPPTVGITAPTNGSLLSTGQPAIMAAYSDSGTGIDPASVRLVVDGLDVTAQAQVTASGLTFTSSAALAEGVHAVAVSVKDRAGNEKSAATGFTTDTKPPTLLFTSPAQPVVTSGADVAVSLAFSDVTSAVAPASLQVSLDGVDLTTRCTVGDVFAVCQPQALTFGLHTASATIRDIAGNQATASLSFEIADLDPPHVTITQPELGTLVSNRVVHVAGTVTDDGEVVRVTVNGVPAQQADGEFSAEVSLAEGGNDIQAVAVDASGKEGSASTLVVLDSTPPEVVVETPQPAQPVNSGAILVSGSASDENDVAFVEVNSVVVPLLDGRFETQVVVADGPNTIAVRAVDTIGNVRDAAVEVTGFTLPEVEISSPEDLSFIAATTVDVTGTVSAPASGVVVNGVTASVAGTSFTAHAVPLIEGSNILTATATVNGRVGTRSINVVRDLTPPRVAIDSPADGAVVTDPLIAVSGLVNDIVAGTVNAAQATVTVNGRPATVSNRSFVVTDVPLAPGENTLTVVATDAGGNVGRVTQVVRLETAPALRLAITGGEDQEGDIGETLPQPLAVILADAAGSPVAGQPVIFAVRANDGTLAGGKRQVAVTTNAQGRASTPFTLGTRAGVQRVEASAVGAVASATFTLAARPGTPMRILVDAGDQQVGTTGLLLPRPLVAAVTDDGFNRRQGIAVRFTVVKGLGHFAAGGQEAVVTTDSDGRAIVPFVLDPEEGIANNVVQAVIDGVTDSPLASFVSSGRAAGDPAATSISGVVLDNADRPIEGVTLRVLDTALTSRTDSQGQFRIAGAPVGTVKLVVDGSTANRPGSWPDLEFVITTIAGRDNTVNMPIYLLPIDLGHGVFVDETHGGTLTLPEAPGFALEIAPGSVTFPAGSKSGVVSVTVVHNDKVPMVPNFGQQPRFIVTIQPAGARFDPPARLTLPNIEGLAPGRVTEFYSFDHDLGHFVSIGPATVTDNGKLIVSNLGVGIVKAGWHCGGDPTTAGTTHRCGACEICVNDHCEPMDARTVAGALAAPACREESGHVVIDRPADGARLFINATPAKPELDAAARITDVDPDPTASTTFDWRVKLRFVASECPHGRGGAVNYFDFQQSVVGSPFHKQLDAVRGGDLTLTAAATVRGARESDQTQDVQIHGTNPPRAAIRAALGGDTLSRMACQESIGQRQFNAAADGGTNKCPLFSGDGLGGVGIMQLTPPPSVNAIWDWTVNVAGGKSKHRSSIAAARNYATQVRNANDFQIAVSELNDHRRSQGLPPVTVVVPEYTAEQIELDGIRGYNGYGTQHDRFGFRLREYRLQEDGEGFLMVTVNPSTGVATAIWERTPVDARGCSGDPNYVKNVLSWTPTCEQPSGRPPKEDNCR